MVPKRSALSGEQLFSEISTCRTQYYHASIMRVFVVGGFMHTSIMSSLFCMLMPFYARTICSSYTTERLKLQVFVAVDSFIASVHC